MKLVTGNGLNAPQPTAKLIKAVGPWGLGISIGFCQ